MKLITLSFFGILLLNACSNNNSEPVEIGGNVISETEASEDIIITQRQFDLAKMEFGQIEDHDFPSSIRASGQIEIPAKNHSRVSAYAGGYVTNINLVPGEKVAKGQLLFTLENPDFVQMQQDYLEAKEQLVYLKSDFERQKTMADENITARKNYLKAESVYRVTLAKMEGMKKRLSLLKINTDNINAQNLVSSNSIYAPSKGYISEVLAMKGMFLNPTDVALEIVNTDHLHLELNIFEKDILKIKKGQVVQFTIPDASPDIYEATVHIINKSVDQEKRVVRVHAHLKNKKDKALFVAGMYVDAKIITDSNTTIGIIESAIVTEEDNNFVLINKGKKDNEYIFEKKEVNIGQRKDGFVQILNNSDFTGQEKILIKGAFNLIGIE